MDLSFSKFDKIQAHNLSLSAGSKTGQISKGSDVRKEYEKTIPEFIQYLIGMRNDTLKDDDGKSVKGHYVNLKQALHLCYGIQAPTNLSQKAQHRWSMEMFLNQFGLSAKTHSLSSIAQTLAGVSQFGAGEACDGLIDARAYQDYNSYASNHSSTAGTPSVPNDFRFLISEMILDIIQVGYQHMALYPNWIGNEITVTNQNDIKMPQIRTGDTMMYNVAEGADIPYGSLQFGQKSVKISKHGIGIELTDELIKYSNLDLASIFLSEVGNDMNIALDSEALFTLINGEQANGSEAPAVVGVENPANGFTYRDTKKVFTRMNALKFPASRLVADEDVGIEISEIEEYKGYEGDRVFSNVEAGIIGVPDRFAIDTQVAPANQALYLNPEKAMLKLNAGGLMVERDRNIQNQTNRIFVSDVSGFAIIQKNARVLQDKTITGINFPAEMDVYSRMAEQYKNLCD